MTARSSCSLMIALAAATLGARPAQAQILAGDSYTLSKHSLGPASQGSTEVLDDTLSVHGVSLGAAAAYPLADSSARRLMRLPFGFALYSYVVDNDIDDENTGANKVAVLKDAVVDDFDFFINTDPMSESLRSDAAAISRASARVSQDGKTRSSLVKDSVVELNLLLDSGEFQDSNLQVPAVLSLAYKDADGDGLVDGASPPIRAKTLAIHVLDEARGLWIKIPNSAVDTAGRKVSAPIPHFSVYALAGSGDQDVGSVYAYPVPWAPNSGDPRDGTLAGGITFTNLPSEGAIRIYTLAGERVRVLDIPPGLFPPRLIWDVKTAAGRNAASGVYIWRVESGRNSKVGKLIVVR